MTIKKLTNQRPEAQTVIQSRPRSPSQGSVGRLWLPPLLRLETENPKERKHLSKRLAKRRDEAVHDDNCPGVLLMNMRREPRRCRNLLVWKSNQPDSVTAQLPKCATGMTLRLLPKVQHVHTLISGYTEGPTKTARAPHTEAMNTPQHYKEAIEFVRIRLKELFGPSAKYKKTTSMPINCSAVSSHRGLLFQTTPPKRLRIR